MSPRGPAPDKRWPHVTEILNGAGLIDTSWFTDEHRERGTAVHKATEYLDQDDLDRQSLDDKTAARVGQYEQFLSTSGCHVDAIELKVHHPLGYCGTLDRLVTINGRPGVLDIKGTTSAKWHAIQLAAYAACIDGPLARWNLYLSDTSFKLEERSNVNDFATFQAAIVLFNYWRDK